ncbi:MAG: hypothetical protein Q7R61_02175 [bacterium]|nr:hypothetical protein [bacterium]
MLNISSESLEHPEESGEKPAQEKPLESQQEKSLKSKVVCAWCKKEMGEKEGIEGGKTSHGICPDCKAKVLSDYLTKKQ